VAEQNPKQNKFLNLKPIKKLPDLFYMQLFVRLVSRERTSHGWPKEWRREAASFNCRISHARTVLQISQWPRLYAYSQCVRPLGSGHQLTQHLFDLVNMNVASLGLSLMLIECILFQSTLTLSTNIGFQ